MAKPKTAYSSYLSTQIETATPGRLLLLLYDGALKRLNLARQSMEREAFEPAHQYLLRVQDILIELMVSLNHEAGGEVAGNLHQLYDYMYRRLVDANIRREIEAIDEAAQILTDLRQAWEKALQQEAGEEQPAPPASLSIAAGAETAAAPPGGRLNLQG